MPELVAVSGYARAGKDTVGRILVERHGFRRVAFADAIRETLLEIDPSVVIEAGFRRLPLSTAVRLFGWEYLKDNAPEVRELLQRAGQGIRKTCGGDVWIRAALDNAEGPIVITDCRYPNEAVSVRARGGEVWRVNRPGAGPTNDHISEIALDDYRFDVRIENDGDVDDLERGIGRYLSGELSCIS